MTGRDGRKSGETIHNIVNSVFSSMGINVIDCGISTTPTLCWGVLNNKSVAGLMITASHNPEEYNGLKFFNSDGSEIDACGNGSRCVANLLMKETKSDKINLTTRERTIACEKIDDVTVSVNMGKPKFKWNEIPLTEDIDPVDINFSIRDLTLKKPFLVNIGNPHIIFFDDEIEKYDVESFGSLIENDSLFPEKINVSFAKLKSDNHIVLNVWERGAGKTNACGTAACATAVAGVEMGLIKNKVTVTLPGGDLEIYYKSSDNIIMTGPTEINFTDKYKL